MRKTFYILLTLSLTLFITAPACAQKKAKKAKTTKKTTKKTKATPKAKKSTSATKDGNNTPEVNVPLDLWNVEKDPETSLYYFVNAETQQAIGEKGFDLAYTLPKGQAVTEVRIRDDRYIMARNGASLLDHAALNINFDPLTHYVQVMDKMSCFLMDFHGRAISAGYDFMMPVGRYLFGVSGTTDETLKIIGIDDKPICEMEVEHTGQSSLSLLSLDTIPAYIVFKQNGKNGVMNYQGDILVPAEFDEIAIHSLSTAKSLPKALKETLDLATYRHCQFFFCSNAKSPNSYTVFDQAGLQVGKVKGDTPEKAFEKNQKKVFTPFFTKHAGNRQQTEEKVLLPYSNFVARMQQYDDTLPKTVRPSTLNLFEKAKERHNSKMN